VIPEPRPEVVELLAALYAGRVCFDDFHNPDFDRRFSWSTGAERIRALGGVLPEACAAMAMYRAAVDQQDAVAGAPFDERAWLDAIGVDNE
jgi:hypothetical protein